MRRPRRLRQLAHRLLGGPPAYEVGRRATASGLDEAVTRGALELALRSGEAMLSLGAPAADVTAAVHGMVKSFGLDGCEVDITFTAITISYDPGGSAVPLTMLRVVVARVDDYARLAGVVTLAREVAATRPGRDVGDRTTNGEPAPNDDPVTSAGSEGSVEHETLARLEAAHARLDEIVRAPHPYRRWMVTCLLGVMAGGVAVLLGGGPGVTVVAALTTVAIDRSGWLLARWRLPVFFRQAVGAAIATLVAVGLLVAMPHLPVELRDFPPSIVVASGIVVLLAGLSLVGSAEDAISGFQVTAGGRAFEVVLLTLGIVAGIGAVLDMARRFGAPLEVIALPGSRTPPVVLALAAAVVAAAWGLASYARPRAALLAAGAGALAWSTYAVGTELGLGPAVASGLGALVVGFLSESVGPRLHVPPIVVSICGIVPLLPGLAIYRALFQLVNNPAEAGGLGPGVVGLVGAAMIGLALAAGVTLGELLAAPLRHRPFPQHA